MKDYENHFIDWMYPYGDEETPATKVDNRVQVFHDYIEMMMGEAYIAGYEKGYSDGIDKALNDD